MDRPEVKWLAMVGASNMTKERHHVQVTSSPAWVRVAEDICRRIQTGEFAVGDPISTQQQLVIRHKVAPGTVKRAIDHLSTAGVLEGRQGVGVFVLRMPTDADLRQARTLEERVASQDERLSVVEAQLAALLEARKGDPAE